MESVNKTNQRIDYKKRTTTTTTANAAAMYVNVALRLCSAQFYVSSESSECQRTRDKGNFHEYESRKKKSAAVAVAEKNKDKKAKFFNGTVKYIMQSRRFIFWMREKKKALCPFYIRIDRQTGKWCTDGGSRLLKHTHTLNETKLFEQMNTQQEKKSSTRRAHMWCHNRALQGKLASRKAFRCNNNNQQKGT